MKIQIEEQILWRIRDLIHHFGVHHPAVAGTQIGSDIAVLGGLIPDIFRDIPLQAGRQEAAEAVFQRHGWGDEPITSESLLDLADNLMLPPFDLGQRLAFRRTKRAFSSDETDATDSDGALRAPW